MHPLYHSTNSFMKNITRPISTYFHSNKFLKESAVLSNDQAYLISFFSFLKTNPKQKNTRIRANAPSIYQSFKPSSEVDLPIHSLITHSGVAVSFQKTVSSARVVSALIPFIPIHTEFIILKVSSSILRSSLFAINPISCLITPLSPHVAEAKNTSS